MRSVSPRASCLSASDRKRPPVRGLTARLVTGLAAGLVTGLAAGLGLVGCGESKGGDNLIQIRSNLEAADGLDLRAVGELIREARDAEHLERLLNREGGINNLDLNEDGKVDFIRVTEFGNDEAKGFSLTVQPAEGETQEIATIEVRKARGAEDSKRDGQKADVYVRGNQQVYGANHHYHFVHPVLPTWLLFAYLWRPHPFYASPFGFGFYPPYFGGGFGVVSHARYTQRTGRMTQRSTGRRVTAPPPRATSPNAGASAKRGIRASLRNPTRSQRAYSARNPSRRVGRGGFGRRAQPRNQPRTTRPAPRSRRSFGGGSSYGRRRSFGGRSFGGRRGGFRRR